MKHLVTVALLLGATTALAGEKSANHITAEDRQWVQAPFGPFISPVSGDAFAGAHMTLVRFSAGMKTPLHTHSNDYLGVVIAGKSRHFEKGKPETEVVLTAGAQWTIPADIEHISECLPGEECVFLLSQSAAFDFMAVEH